MSTADYVGLCGGERDFRRWSQDVVTRTMSQLDQARDVRERMLFSAWVNTLRDEWEQWCVDYEGRGPC